MSYSSSLKNLHKTFHLALMLGEVGESKCFWGIPEEARPKSSQNIMNSTKHRNGPSQKRLVVESDLVAARQHP
jgi:hypothetical protein